MTKKALLVGIKYRHLKPLGNLELKKAHGDVQKMKNLLIKHFDYIEDNIVILTDEDKNSPQWPNKVNILEALKTLVHGAQDGDTFFFHFAGHGSQKECNDDSEIDGLDELIWPIDVRLGKPEDPQRGEFGGGLMVIGGYILDNDLKEYLVDPLRDKENCKLVAIMDCCHSGTSLDLINTSDDNLEPFSPVGYRQGAEMPPVDSHESWPSGRAGPKFGLPYHGHHEDHHDGEHPGAPFVVSLSACLDPQIALDLSGGRLCHHLQQILESDMFPDNLTYRNLYSELLKRLGEDALTARTKGGLKLESKTKPQLCSSLPLKWVWDEPFEL